MATLMLSVCLSSCGSGPASSGSLLETEKNEKSEKTEELERKIEELEAENKELKAENKVLKAQIDNSDAAGGSQQTDNETESLIKAAIGAPENNGVCGADLTWYYQNGILVIKGTGEMMDYEDGESPWYEIRDKVGWAFLDDGITTIGDAAFCALKNLSKISIPDTVTSIGAYAFYTCGFREVTLPDSLESIGHKAFANCSLKEITFPASLAHIDTQAFLSASFEEKMYFYVMGRKE